MEKRRGVMNRELDDVLPDRVFLCEGSELCMFYCLCVSDRLICPDPNDHMHSVFLQSNDYPDP
jgi:hypothetical protein